MNIDLFQLLANYGVLGIVLAWFMFRMEKTIKENTKAINSLKDVVSLFIDKVNNK